MEATNLAIMSGQRKLRTVVNFERAATVFWGHFILHEFIGWHTFIGACVVILGTALVTGFSVSLLFAKHSSARRM